MDILRRYGNIFKLDGTNQLQRMPLPLEKDYILPDERSFVNLIKYARALAGELHYYSLTGKSVGNWRAMFDELTDDTTGEIYTEDKLQHLLNTKNNWSPHVALFLVFLKLFRYLQKDLNDLPVRHLRHFYEKQLSLLRGQARADEVHVLFELIKSASVSRLQSGTLIDVGKDA